MVRQFLFHAEIAILIALQLLILGAPLIGAWPAIAQTLEASAQPSPARLGAFLAQYPDDKSEKLVQSFGLWQLGDRAFVGYRAQKETKKSPIYAMPKVRESFTAECKGLGGHIAKFDNPADFIQYFEIEKKLALDNSNPPLVCADAEELPMGALFTDSYRFRNGDRFSAIFVMTAEAATEMVVIYHRGKAKELRLQADIAEKVAADEKRWSDWRSQLTIGSETHCGPILELRGPMAQVAYGTQAGWVRRERLYPPQGASRCWEFSGL